ncbi:YegP family protein [Congregibacter variabilis]|uniref:YegP family protein n=1 Tax=Congregibacter variabilis TaxID=3081200 RepID=A0ABZ0I279_9GAMM|nr:YegP family protein [Congregibacter sp. IMCC43200]
MAGKFELKKGKTGKFSFNLKSGNGQVVFTSQTYDNKRSATAGIASVKKNADKDARYERKSSTKGQPYFVMKATNGQVVGKSQMYSNAVSMEKGIKSVGLNAPSADTVDLTVEAPKAKAAPKKKAAAKKAKAAPKKKAVAKKAKAAPKKAKAAAKKVAKKAKAAPKKAKAAAKKVVKKVKAAPKKAKAAAKKKAPAKAKAKKK